MDSGIRKGDIVINSDNGLPYILDWQVHPESNNLPSRALYCNLYLTIERDYEEVDSRGYLIEESGKKTIVDHLPCNAYRYDGRPEYSASSNTPGVSPNAYTLMTVQFNEQSKHIRVNDEFEWGEDIYKVVDVSRVGVDLAETHGCLTLRCRRKSGGLDYD